MQKLSLVSLFIYLFTFTSCSWLGRRKALFDSSSREQADVQTEHDSVNDKGKFVPQSQYDQLLGRYDDLQRRYDEIRGHKNPGRLLADLGRSKSVDMLNAEPQENKVINLGKLSSSSKKKGAIQREIEQLNTANAAFANQKLDYAMKLYKILEKSSHEQVRVRAKYKIGEVLFEQKDYDLAMQAYEEIVQKHAFSGIVIKSLGKLIACAEKLKLTKKKDKYYSVLHDFFKYQG